MASSLPRNAFRLTAVRDALRRITDFRVTEASALVAALVRRPISQVTGATLREIFPSPRIDAFVERFADTLVNGTPHTDEYPVLTDALDATWIRQTTVREDDGVLLVTVDDLTSERLQAVRAEVSTRLRELLFEKASDGIVLVGPDGRVAEANEAFAAMVKLEHRALIGLRIPDHLDCPTWEPSVEKSFHCQLRAADQGWLAVAVRETPPPYGFRQLVFHDRSALEASEGRYRAALHAANLTAWEIDQATERLTVSESHRTLFDLTPEMPLPTTLSELRAMVHPEDRYKIWSQRVAISDTPGTEPIPFEVQYRIVTPDGAVRWMRSRGELTRRAPGDPGTIYCITRNITRIIETEARLRESEEHFRSAFEESAVGMALLANDGATLQVNSALASMLGYTAAEAMQLHWTAVLHPDEIGPSGALLQEVASGRVASSRDERRCIRRDGTEIWTQMTIAGVRGGDGVAEHLIVQVEDISERKHLETSRREVEERLALVLDATSDGIWDWDVPAGMVHYGPQWFGILGYPAEARTGELAVFSQLVHPEDLLQLWPEVERHLQAPSGAYDEEFRMRHADGHWVWIRARGRAVKRDAEGRALRMVGTHTDVTRERSLEEQIRHGQKMDAVGKLAGGVAHDFNNLLTAIGATTELLLDAMPLGSPHHQDLEHIALAADRAKALTRQLLAFSRQEVEQSADVNVDAVVEQVAPLLHRMLGPAQSLQIRLGAAGQTLRLDPANLELALLNLVANARDAMSHGGTVTIETAVEGDAPEPIVVITVRDTGIGMTADVRERIFEPFFTTKPQGKGTGLGMPTVYGFVRRLQGTVDVESAPGAGTTVRLVLPVLSVPFTPVPTATNQPDDTPGRVVRRVLLVDDDAVVRRSTQRLLEHRGIEVVGVDSADAALAELASTSVPFDVVLSDHAMPGRTGHQLLEEIGVRYPAQRVVLMSGFADDGELRRTFGTREVPFLAKPFTLQELLQALGG